MKKLLSNASIGLKVALAPAVAIACLAVVAAVGFWANRSLSTELAAIGRDGIERIAKAEGLAGQLADLHQKVYQSLAWEAIGQRAEKIKELDDGLLRQLDAFDKATQAAAADASLPEPTRVALASFGKGLQNYVKLARDTLDIKSAGVASAGSFVVTLDGQYLTSLQQVKTIVQQEKDRTAATVAGAEAVAARNSGLIVGTSLVALALAALLAWQLSAGRLAEGDLRAHAAEASADATGRVLSALSHVAANLTGIVADVRSSAQSISAASGEIASGNADLSARTESAAATLQQAAAAVEQLSATIRTSAEQARDANHMAQEASTVASAGGKAVAEVVSTMESINGQAKKIAEIIGTIDGIAFQTNILALNAAVEAARAGEQGRGFSVVASEVRALAQRSGDAAREIRTLIGASVEQIDAGTGKVQAAGATMQRVVGAIQAVAGTVDGIARAAAEQADGIAQVNQTVAEMDRSTQQNAAMVEQAAAATASLRQQADTLVQLLTRFRTA
jgi:methyl-accepting chemotaxis protein